MRHPSNGPRQTYTSTSTAEDRAGCNERLTGGCLDVSTDLLAQKYRADFPILEQRVNGHPLVYLDNAASTQHPTCVIDEIARYYREDHANVHRGIHELSSRATRLYEDARAQIARFIGAESQDSIIFTRGTTEGINLVATAWGSPRLRPGDVILITEMEHHANLIPWQILARRTGALLQYLPVQGDEGSIDWSLLERSFGGIDRKTEARRSAPASALSLWPAYWSVLPSKAVARGLNKA